MFRDVRSILGFVQDVEKKAWDPANPAHERIFKICGLKNRLDPDYNSEDTFGFRDLQFNLEVGFKDGALVPCHEWEADGVQRHICEIQVLTKSFGKVLEKHEYSLLRDMAGK